MSELPHVATALDCHNSAVLVGRGLGITPYASCCSLLPLQPLGTLIMRAQQLPQNPTFHLQAPAPPKDHTALVLIKFLSLNPKQRKLPLFSDPLALPGTPRLFVPGPLGHLQP